MAPTPEIVPLTGHLGAELHRITLAGAPEPTVRVLHDALLRHQVVFVPEQHLAPAELLALAGSFGEIMRNPTSPKVDGFPDVTELVTHDGRSPDMWHFDTSYVAAPPMASLLTMVRSPAVGGDTMWVSGYALLDALSPAMRELAEQVTVRYESPSRAVDHFVAEHPLVTLHPETGRASLAFDSMYATRVVELRRAESDALLGFLRTHVADPSYACRYRWREGTFAMWDNRCTMHRVASDYEGERIIHRVTVAGTTPLPARARAPR
jgi:taurine dioxygenase